jgi:hypothetical protein
MFDKSDAADLIVAEAAVGGAAQDSGTGSRSEFL